MKRFIALALALLMLLSLLLSALADSPHTHNWKEVKRTDPTCTEKGQITYRCSCGRSKWETIPALGHEFSQQVYTSYADCTHYGVFYWVCERCGAHSGTGNDKPLGHDWEPYGTVTKEPTETDEGEITYTCKRDPSHTKTEPIPCLTASEPEGKAPSLSFSMTWQDTLDDHSVLPEVSGVYYSIATTNTVTNTGNVPLDIRQCLYDSDMKMVETNPGPSYYHHVTLQPGESFTCDEYYVQGFSSDYYPSWDKCVHTPEDPLYEAYAFITVWYRGYPEGIEILNDNSEPPLCESNVCTAIVKIPREGSEEEPHGIKAMKAEAHGPANGEYYELGETIDYVITITNDSAGAINNVAVFDSLAGFEPIAAAETFAQGETLKFEYSAVITDEEITKAQAVNSAVVTFTYGDDASATPRFSNWVYSKAGNTETPETAHFDKAKLDAVPEFSSDAETAEQWNAEAEKLYAALWEAGDDTAKCAVLEERAMFYSYLEALESKTGDAASFRRSRSEALWERLASLAGITDTEAAAVPVGLSWEELIAETLRLKCVQLLDLINELP